MANSGLFRIQVLLNHFYDNHKRKSYVMVNKEWKNVRQLHAHLDKIFHLDDKIFLTTENGIYLPDKENIGVIKEDETIVVYPKGAATNNGAINVTETVPLHDATVNTEFKVPTGVARRSEPTSSSASIISGILDGTDTSFDLIDSQENGSNAESIGKRKRKRKRKKKTNADTNDDVNNASLQLTSVVVADQNAVKQQAATSVANFKGHSKSKPNAHVRFIDDEADDDDNSSLDEIYQYPTKARIIRAINHFIPSNNSLNGPMQTNDATMSNGKPKINGLPPSDDPMTFNETTSTIGPTLSDFIKTPTDRPQDESAIPDETKLLSVSDLHENTTKSTFECILPNTKEIQTISPDEKPTENLRTKATALEALAQNSEQLDSFARMEPKTPIKIGDIIAFKVFTPSLEISNYIIALVEVVHIPSDKSFDTINMDYDLTIEIMAGKPYIKHLLFTDTDEEDHIQITISRIDLFEPRFVTFENNP